MSPGTGTVRGTAPSAITSSSQRTVCAPSSVSIAAVRASRSTAVARPSRSSACGHIARSGTIVWRGSSVPDAASGSSGV